MNRFVFIIVKIHKSAIALLGFIVLCMILLFYLAYSKVAPTVTYDDLTGVIVVIDPGHGGIDGGAHDKMGVLEKDINLAISLKIRDFLVEKNAVVHMTRERDVSLEDKSDLHASRYRRDLDGRKDIINGSGANLLVSIHTNANPSYRETQGAIIFYHPNKEDSKILAQRIAKEITEEVYKGLLQSETLRCKVLDKNYYIIRETIMPGVLIEVGFITNEEEKQRLQQPNYQERMAAAIANGIIDYVNRPGDSKLEIIIQKVSQYIGGLKF